LNNSETKDCFVNGAEIQGFNCNWTRGKIKKRRFSLNRGPIAKCQKFRGQIEIIQISNKKTVSLLKQCSSPPPSVHRFRRNGKIAAKTWVFYLSCPLSPIIPNSSPRSPHARAFSSPIKTTTTEQGKGRGTGQRGLWRP